MLQVASGRIHSNLAVVRVISGGQTGVDRAALDWAIAQGIPHGGWCPMGRRAEDGAIPSHYNLCEAVSHGYAKRTRLNVEDSDATLILNLGALDGGTQRTVQICQRLHKPYLVVQLDASDGGNVNRVREWLVTTRPLTLNVAGPRESKCPGVHAKSLVFLDSLHLMNPSD